ncbi:uncharacterized protein MYCFIDRAFT_80745 [Pseudocercospora fijiensis CIRAD86]|uniref:Uncharacterized protein n=1 Tax=Pseudocercospora fijiensis (strain CIRAD86) TaxID=383855 RepID=M3AMH9_PSEFD|nr:uncharacterized protein MYCFIDRAFT_80745 [Pseudocercospora fijiensis CIRAD86]EME78323.1 hypothetical protein MYCFIDRAFT_80745 [Pseudocercospora fijiensis CIRAD86]
MLPLPALLTAGSWSSLFAPFNTVYAPSQPSMKDILLGMTAIASTAFSDSPQTTPQWHGLGYCGSHGVIKLPPSVKARKVPMGCEDTASKSEDTETADSQHERAAEEPRNPSSVGLGDSPAPLHLPETSTLSKHLHDINWLKLSIQSTIQLVCPATIPFIAAANMLENGYDIYEKGFTRGNVFGLAVAGLVLFGPGGNELLSAAGFDKLSSEISVLSVRWCYACGWWICVGAGTRDEILRWSGTQI